MGACFEVRAHLLLISTMRPSCETAAIHTPGRPALRCTRRLHCEVLRSTWLVGMGTKAVVRERVRLAWVDW